MLNSLFTRNITNDGITYRIVDSLRIKGGKRAGQTYYTLLNQDGHRFYAIAKNKAALSTTKMVDGGQKN